MFCKCVFETSLLCPGRPSVAMLIWISVQLIARSTRRRAKRKRGYSMEPIQIESIISLTFSPILIRDSGVETMVRPME